MLKSWYIGFKICILVINLKGKRSFGHLLCWQHHWQTVNPLTFWKDQLLLFVLYPSVRLFLVLDMPLAGFPLPKRIEKRFNFDAKMFHNLSHSHKCYPTSNG